MCMEITCFYAKLPWTYIIQGVLDFLINRSAFDKLMTSNLSFVYIYMYMKSENLPCPRIWKLHVYSIEFDQYQPSYINISDEWSWSLQVNLIEYGLFLFDFMLYFPFDVQTHSSKKNITIYVKIHLRHMINSLL